MSALVVDTSSWVSYFAGRGSDLIDDALREARVWLTPLVVAELMSGKMAPRQRRSLEDLLRELPLCECGFDHWVRVGMLRQKLARRGVSISTPDAHIAQCALDLDAELLTEDKVFDLVAKHQPLALA